MSVILHHYPPSLFSEKIRVMFGFLGMQWSSVIIPAIMPRPHLMPLSGGYRKTPIMQIGANVYCDTAIICRRLAQLADAQAASPRARQLYQHGFVADRVARWADTELFRRVVALNFRPEALAAQMSQMSAEEMAAFQADRAELSGGAPLVAGDPAAAESHFQADLAALEQRLSSQPFLFGDEPSIADFSVYHCLWFVLGNPANAALVQGWSSVSDFCDRMSAFGHGDVAEISAEQALSVGADATPEYPGQPRLDPGLSGTLQLGDAVTVTPDDYGRIGVSGKLVHWSYDEIAVLREDPQAGDIMVHFPNQGFEVAGT